jgi:hypothetical protein
MINQRIDVGDLVEYSPAATKKYRAVVLDRKNINPNFDDPNRVFHPDEYHCFVLILNSEIENDQRWVRTKWLKLLSKSS